MSALPNANHWAFKSITLHWACRSQVAPGDICQVGGWKDKPWQGLGGKNKWQFLFRANPLLFCVMVSKMKSKISVMLSPTPCTFLHTLFLDITQWKWNRDTHTIDVSINETQSLCLSYCTQMVNTTLAPPAKTTVKWVDESARLLRVGNKGRENGMLQGNSFSFRKFVTLKQRC